MEGKKVFAVFLLCVLVLEAIQLPVEANKKKDDKKTGSPTNANCDAHKNSLKKKGCKIMNATTGAVNTAKKKTEKTAKDVGKGVKTVTDGATNKTKALFEKHGPHKKNPSQEVNNNKNNDKNKHGHH